MKLYSYWRSSASYRVRIALNLKQIPYEYVPVHLVKDGGQQHQEQYTNLNPSHLVPTLVEFENEIDLVLNQSLAIIEYLDERFPDVCRLLPEHRFDRARVRTVVYDLACDTQPIQNLRVLNYLSDELQVTQEQRNDFARHWIEKGLQSVEKRIQNTAADFCFGFNVTMADVVLVPQYYNAVRFGIDMSQFPQIERVVKHCSSLPAFIDALPENQPDAAV